MKRDKIKTHPKRQRKQMKIEKIKTHQKRKQMKRDKIKTHPKLKQMKRDKIETHPKRKRKQMKTDKIERPAASIWFEIWEVVDSGQKICISFQRNFLQISISLGYFQNNFLFPGKNF